MAFSERIRNAIAPPPRMAEEAPPPRGSSPPLPDLRDPLAENKKRPMDISDPFRREAQRAPGYAGAYAANYGAFYYDVLDVDDYSADSKDV